MLAPIAGRDCRQEPARKPEAPPVASAPAPTPTPDLFLSSVRPVLSTRCAPCHEPGGKMYERLPFDRGDVVAAHRAGVLKRIREPEEREAIERWLAAVDSRLPAAVGEPSRD